jgi:hypothetical protein
MEGFAHPWYISSGWAIDLFLGRATRVHHDVDIVIDRDDQLVLRQHLEPRGWKLLSPYEGRLAPWPPATRLEPPRDQIHAHVDGAFIDFLLSPIAGGVWRYRRQPVILRAAERMALRTDGGIPYLAPELVLLFKSRNTSGKARGKDQADFESIADHLDSERRAWLRWALTATDPSHPWIAELT